MTPRQKRTFNRARKAIVELASAAIEDGDAYNAGMTMVADSLGTMIGVACATQAQSPEEAHAATVRAARRMQEKAAEAYGMYLAAESNANGVRN